MTKSRLPSAWASGGEAGRGLRLSAPATGGSVGPGKPNAGPLPIDEPSPSAEPPPSAILGLFGGSGESGEAGAPLGLPGAAPAPGPLPLPADTVTFVPGMVHEE